MRRAHLLITVGRVSELDFETRQIHAGTVVDAEVGARVTPVYQTAGYLFDSLEDGEARFAGRDPAQAYSRNDNPTNAVAGRRIADLEGGAAGIVVGSGQAAIVSAIFSLAAAGDHVLATERLYEGTRQLFEGAVARQGVTVEYVPEDASEERWASRVTGRTRAIYTETIPNPRNDVVDLGRLAHIAHAAGVPLVVDNTVATPYLCRPIEWGADIVVHSTSKWLSGHGSVIGGAIVDAGRFDWAAHRDRFPFLTEAPRHGAPSFVERAGALAWFAYLRGVTLLDLGPSVPAASSFLLLHGIETLSLRMERHVENAQRIAEWLEQRAEVERVDYPGLPSNRYHERAKRYLPRGAGSIVTIDLVGGREAAARFLGALRLVSNMTHIGDVRTLALHSASTIHARLDESERQRLGILQGTIRLSIGIESVRDIIADLQRGLGAI